MRRLVKLGIRVTPIISQSVADTDTRFYNSLELREAVFEITKTEIITSIKDAEPLGPGGHLDILVIAPCTGNTIAKLANAITDGCILMAAKAHLRNNKPLLLGISTNDGLSANAKNIGSLLVRKNIYFVPFGQE
jgi:dipicolinate synthase subunit B